MSKKTLAILMIVLGIIASLIFLIGIVIYLPSEILAVFILAIMMAILPIGIDIYYEAKK